MEDRPIAFVNQVLTAAKKRYSITEIELLAICFAFHKFHSYVYGQPIIVLTDHIALRKILTQKTPNARLARWGLTVASYDAEIRYRRGQFQSVSDCLSRLHKDEMNNENDDLLQFDLLYRSPSKDRHNSRDPMGELPSITGNQINQIVNFAEEQLKDENLMEILRNLKEKANKSQGNEMESKYQMDPNTGILTYKSSKNARPVPVVPKHLQLLVIHACHDLPFGGHMARDKTLSRITPRFYWKGMSKAVEDYIQHCEECQRF